MEKKIFLELFRFNVETDYLPYFAKLELKINTQSTLQDVLKLVESKLEHYAFSAYGFKINGVVVFDFSLSVESLLKEFGVNWKIEPLNAHLALKDLIIDIKPFLEKLEILRNLGLDELAQDELQGVFKDSTLKNIDDRENAFLLSFLPFAYATPLAVENPSYLGEAFFILVASLYAKHKRVEILESICSLENGILNAQNLKNYIFPKSDKFDLCINELKTIVFECCESKDICDFKTKLLRK